jgi:Na+/H+ antiporter NhaA
VPLLRARWARFATTSFPAARSSCLTRTGESTFLGDFLRKEAIGGVIVLVAAAVAVVWANSPAAGAMVPIVAVLAGVAIETSSAFLIDPVVVGVVLGLVVGKPLGVLGGAWVTTRFTRAELGEGLTWREMFGVAVLAGVGFTVALLVAELSYTGATAESAKTAVLVGSLLAAVLASFVLGRRNREHKRA